MKANQTMMVVSSLREFVLRQNGVATIAAPNNLSKKDRNYGFKVTLDDEITMKGKKMTHTMNVKYFKRELNAEIVHEMPK